MNGLRQLNSMYDGSLAALKGGVMRKWGMLVTAFYALIVAGLLVPGAALLAGGEFSNLGEVYSEWGVWIWIGLLVSGQALLLFLSVDTSWKRVKPRAHILVSYATTALFLTLLTAAAIWSLVVVGIPDTSLFDSGTTVLGLLGFLWLFWGILFYSYYRDSSIVVTKAVSWLLKGSVLELLVVVPCHVIARRRDDCSAPMVTSLGMATGIAVMFLSFGPSVLLLYKKRLDAYSTRGPATN
jgi:hypothetical protein